MKKKLIKGLLIATALFVALLLFRLIWGYIKYPDGQTTQYRQSAYATNFSWNRQNIASYKGKVQKFSGKAAKPRAAAPDISSGKYEKVGSIVSESKQFDKDEEKVYAVIKQYKSIIQFEQKTGLKDKNSRLLKLGIGVNPADFDKMIVDLQKIGKLVSVKIIKTEKTNEYKNLQAKRQALEKSRAALAKYRGVGNKVKELISLEDRILQIENEIQSFGVQLGDFDSINEFVTVKLVLAELRKIKTVNKIPFVHRLKTALEWTLKRYLNLIEILFYLVLLILGALLAFLVLMVIIEKLKIVKFKPVQINLGKSDSSE